MTIKIDMLRCFVTVAESGNLSDAGARLGRSVSAVSMMLKQMEDHLGKPLFETDRKSKLSPVGQFVLAQARIEISRFDRTVESIERFATAGAGLVRVAAVPSVAGTLLPTVFKEMVRAHPNVQLQLRDMDSAGVVGALVREQIDIGIATAPDRLSDFERVRLFSDRFGIVCAKDHPLAHSTAPLTWDALDSEAFISNALAQSISTAAFQRYFDQAQMRVQNTVSLLAMVRAGLGVTVLPRMAVLTNSAGLAFCPVDDPQALRRIDMLHRSGNSQSPAAEALKSIIVETTASLLNDAKLGLE
jgi:DNA-binding transcriptional LysR family regulator